MPDRLAEIEAYYRDMPDQSMVRWLIEEVKRLRFACEQWRADFNRITEAYNAATARIRAMQEDLDDLRA